MFAFQAPIEHLLNAVYLKSNQKYGLIVTSFESLTDFEGQVL